MKKRDSESNRKQDYCAKCKIFKKIKAKGNCQSCWNTIKRRTRPEFFLRMKYTEITQRCTNLSHDKTGRYQGKQFCTREEFLEKFINDSTFLSLFENWKLNNYEYKLNPSIDRIDTSGGYTLDNIQFLTHEQNCRKDQ